ncbi:MAG TPA: DUF3341 domain-containing protein [Tepidisphaeraceae bacterium]|jgi:hypothetical protein|nr:DUF3341 domain-containing protein [Tepidisphaeraceae bacterium]
MSTTIHPNPYNAATEVDIETPELVGILAEFDNVDQVVRAAQMVRRAGFTRWDVHTPFPIHGIDYAMGIKPTILPWLVLGMGLFGFFGGLWLQWYANASAYTFIISGKPMWSLPANIPVAFECTILCSAYTAVFAMLALNRLPMHYNPLFKIERFRRVTQDRFFVAIDAADPRFDEVRVRDFLNKLGALAVERVED